MKCKKCGNLEKDVTEDIGESKEVVEDPEL